MASELPPSVAWAAFAIPVAELLLPVLALSRRPWLSDASTVALTGLYVAFSIFHVRLIRMGNFESCSCFGSFLSTSPFHMLAVCVVSILLLTVSLSPVWLALTRWRERGSKLEVGFFHVAAAALVASLFYRSSAALATTEPPLFITEPATPNEVQLLREVAEFRMNVDLSNGEAFFAFVDPNCPYSRVLLRQIRDGHAKLVPNLHVLVYPVIDPS